MDNLAQKMDKLSRKVDKLAENRTWHAYCDDYEKCNVS